MLTQTKQAPVAGPYDTAASLAGGSTLVPAGGPAHLRPVEVASAGGPAGVLAIEVASAVGPSGGPAGVRPVEVASAVGPAGVLPVEAPSTDASGAGLGADLAGLAGLVASPAGRLGHSAQWPYALAARVVWCLAGPVWRSARWLMGIAATSSRRTGQSWAGITHFLAFPLAWLCAAYGVWRIRAADQRGSQITDNLGLVVIGIVAIIAIGGLISGLDKTVFNWVTTQLGLSSGGSAG